MSAILSLNLCANRTPFCPHRPAFRLSVTVMGLRPFLSSIWLHNDAPDQSRHIELGRSGSGHLKVERAGVGSLHWF